MDRGQYGAGDRPGFVDLMFHFFKDNGGSGEWHYYPESGVNAQSAARYKALWKQ